MFQFVKTVASNVKSIIDNSTGAIVGVVGTGFAVVGQSAHAVALDTTSASAAMSSISDTVPVIGGLFLGVLGLMAAWKLARGLFA